MVHLLGDVIIWKVIRFYLWKMVSDSNSSQFQGTPIPQMFLFFNFKASKERKNKEHTAATCVFVLFCPHFF